MEQAQYYEYYDGYADDAGLYATMDDGSQSRGRVVVRRGGQLFTQRYAAPNSRSGPSTSRGYYVQPTSWSAGPPGRQMIRLYHHEPSVPAIRHELYTTHGERQPMNEVGLELPCAALACEENTSGPLGPAVDWDRWQRTQRRCSRVWQDRASRAAHHSATWWLPADQT